MPLLGIQRQKQNVKKKIQQQNRHTYKKRKGFWVRVLIFIKNDYFMYNLFQNGYYNLCTI